MKDLQHENIVKLYDFFENLVGFFFVTEYLPDGNLLTKIK